MRQVKLQKVNKPVSKLERKEKIIFKDTPTKMAAKSASVIPTADLPSKLNAAVKKAKELGISNDKPKVKGTGAASSYQPSKSANDNATRYKAPNATVSKVNFEREKWEKGLSGNVPMGSGSKSKPSSESSLRYKSQK